MIRVYHIGSRLCSPIPMTSRKDKKRWFPHKTVLQNIVLAQQVTFLNKASVLKTLDAIPAESSVEIDASASVFIHPDIVEIINNFLVAAREKAIHVTVIGLDRHHQVGGPGGMKVAVKYPSHPQPAASALG